mgnify:CR=1 FL=1
MHGAQIDDLNGRLLLRGTTVDDPDVLLGVLFHPVRLYSQFRSTTAREESGNNNDDNTPRMEQRTMLLRKLASFLCYKGILESTLDSETVTHCHGLHKYEPSSRGESSAHDLISDQYSWRFPVDTPPMQ